MDGKAFFKELWVSQVDKEYANSLVHLITGY